MNIMKVRFLLLAIAALCLYSCSSNQTKSDLTKHKANGQIYCMYHKVYEAKMEDGNLVYGGLAKNCNTSYFDQEGKLYQFQTHNKNGHIKTNKSFEYDQENNLVKTTLLYYKNMNVVETCENLYSYLDGKLDIIKEYRNSQLLTLKKYTYSQDNIAKITTYDNNDQIIDCIEYKSYQDKNPTEISFTNNAYENNCTLKYKNGLWVEMIFDQTNKIEVERDDNGLPITSSRCTFTYGEDGEEYEISDLQIRYEYEYDQQGNWIKRVSYNRQTNQPINILDREITYYSTDTPQ